MLLDNADSDARYRYQSRASFRKRTCSTRRWLESLTDGDVVMEVSLRIRIREKCRYDFEGLSSVLWLC